MPIVTDPYCPAIGDTTPDDLAFIVESGEELPAARKELRYVTCGKKGADSQEETIDCVVSHHHAPFQQSQIIEIGFLCPRNMATRTYAQFSSMNSRWGLVELAILKRRQMV